MTLKRPSVSSVTALRVVVFGPTTNSRPSPGPRKTTFAMSCTPWRARSWRQSRRSGRPTASAASPAGVLLSAQSAAGLLRARTRAPPGRQLPVVLFRSPMPAEVAALAGSERTPEGAWSFPGGTDVPPNRVTVTERHRAQLDQDQVRAARVGEAQIIAAGRVERTRIIQTAIPAQTHSRVEALLSHGPSRPLAAPRGNSQEPDERRTSAPPRRAPADNQPGGPGPAADAVRLAGLTALPSPGALHPSTPGRALDRREVPPPVQPGQGSAPPAPPPGALDPCGRSPVRRYRPPGLGQPASRPRGRSLARVG
jgi:hypothetical protein